MNHKAVANCPHGHKFEFGTCKVEVKKLFGGTKICGSKGFEEISNDRVQCVGCNTVFTSVTCPECGVAVPVSHFRKDSLFSKLG